MDVNSCEGHPYTEILLINTKNVQKINMHIFRKKNPQALVTVSTPDLIKWRILACALHLMTYISAPGEGNGGAQFSRLAGTLSRSCF